MSDVVTEVLLKMRKLLERGWTRSAYARNAHGDPCPPHAPDAASWCLFGAVDRAIYDARMSGLPFPPDIRRQVGERLRLANKNHGLTGFNDCEATTLSDVLALVDRARGDQE